MARAKPPANQRDKLAPPALRAPASKADKELLFKGVLLALIGAIIVLAPHFARSVSVRELMAGASVVGWFALLLGCAFIGLFLQRRFTSTRRR